jgi:pilus assembly protein CpaF
MVGGLGVNQPFHEEADGFLAERRRESVVHDQPNVVQGLIDQVRSQVVETFSAVRLGHPDDEVRGTVEDMARREIAAYEARAAGSGEPGLSVPAEQVAKQILAAILGLGPLDDLLAMPGVEDIAVNGPDEVQVYRGGGWEDTGVDFGSEEQLLLFLNNAIAHTGRTVSPLEPVVDATITGGHRINVVMRPCAEPSVCAAIRVRRRTGFTVQDFVGRDMRQDMVARPRFEVPDYVAEAVEGAMLTAQAARFLHYAVLAGMNIVVVGGTGTGKTSLLSLLGSWIPAWLRILVIEDTRELNMRPSTNGVPNNCVYFTTRLASLEGTSQVSQSDLVRAALRQRPDALTLGEARGGEILDLLKALCTGHRNGLTSVHADSVAELVPRLKLMFQEAEVRTEVRDDTVAEWIAQAFHLAVALEMAHVTTSAGQGKVRRLSEIVEFSGITEGGQPSRQTLFKYDERRGRLVRQGVMLTRRGQEMLASVRLDYRDIMAMDEGGRVI